jgi:hypothetical protein
VDQPLNGFGVEVWVPQSLWVVKGGVFDFSVQFIDFNQFRSAF